eukprot:1112506-Heterocapsa_arctica.AAC.1
MAHLGTNMANVWRPTYLRLVKFNGWKLFNKVGYVLSCMDPREDKQLTGSGENQIRPHSFVF